MKLQKGFTLIELMVSMGIVVTVVAIATGTLLQAEHATTAVAYQANNQENLRAGMHFMVRDLMQAGEGIRQGGVSLPYTALSAVNRPGTATIFPNTYTTLPAITPGWKVGQFATSLNPSTGATLTGVQTDIINIIYADNVLQDTAGNYLYSYPIIQAAPSHSCLRGNDWRYGRFSHARACLFHHARGHESHHGGQFDHVS